MSILSDIPELQEQERKAHGRIYAAFAENHILRLIPEELKTISPDMKVQLNENFEGTSFNCDECGGDVIPFTLKKGVCFQCKTVADLYTLSYESKDDMREDPEEDGELGAGDIGMDGL